MKSKKKIFISVISLIITLIVITVISNVFLPVYVYESHTLMVNDKIYVSYSNNVWSIIGRGKLIGKGKHENTSPLNLIFPDKIYSIENDDTNEFIWYEPFLSEFGGEMYVSSNFIFPSLEKIEPEKIIIGDFRSYKNIDNSVFAYSDNKEIIKIYKSIIDKNFEYDFDNVDLSLLEETFQQVPYFSLITEQVPGCAYTSLIREDGGKYYIYSEDNKERYDISYLYYIVITNGSVTKNNEYEN